MFRTPMDEAPRWCLLPLLLTAGLSVALFIYPQPFLQLAHMAVLEILGG